MSALRNEDVRLAAGPMVRIRAPLPADGAAVAHLLASPDAARIGGIGEEAGEHGTLVADSPWGGQIIGHAAWGRLSGPARRWRSPSVSVSARWPLAAHLMIRLARLADAALIPTLVVTGSDRDDDFERS